jgi:hypothetical protein
MKEIFLWSEQVNVNWVVGLLAMYVTLKVSENCFWLLWEYFLWTHCPLSGFEMFQNVIHLSVLTLRNSSTAWSLSLSAVYTFIGCSDFCCISLSCSRIWSRGRYRSSCPVNTGLSSWTMHLKGMVQCENGALIFNVHVTVHVKRENTQNGYCLHKNGTSQPPRFLVTEFRECEMYYLVCDRAHWWTSVLMLLNPRAHLLVLVAYISYRTIIGFACFNFLLCLLLSGSADQVVSWVVSWPVSRLLGWH